MNTYFGQQQGLTHQQLAEAARAMNLPTNRGTLRRITRANAILYHGLVKATTLDYLFLVGSQSGLNKTYIVFERDHQYQCTCPDYAKRWLPCKHIISVMAYNSLLDLAYQEEVVEACDPQGGYYRFIKLVPTSNQIPTLEISDV